MAGLYASDLLIRDFFERSEGRSDTLAGKFLSSQFSRSDPAENQGELISVARCSESHQFDGLQ